MDCSRFRRQYLAYLDQTLSEADTTAASRHLLACAGCSAHDALVRRTLLVARNLPDMRPSAAFRLQLASRLAPLRRGASSLHA